MRSRLLALLLGFASLFMAASVLAPPVLAQGLPSGPGRCSGSFVNPVTDVCWGCMFPLSLGSLKIWPSSRADTDNPGSSDLRLRHAGAAHRPGGGFLGTGPAD